MKDLNRLQDEGKQQSLTAKFAETQDSLIVTGISPDGFAMSLSDGSVKVVPQALFDRLSVEYLTPFTDPQLFVARYELQLPSKEKIRKFLMQENGNTKR